MSTTSSSFDPVQTWVASRCAADWRPGPDDDLFDRVITDSLDFVEFLLAVEEARAAPIATDDIDIEAFRTLKRIREAFFA